MVPKQYKLSYIPIFYDDLYEAVSYIILKLKNVLAAEELLEQTEKAIHQRLSAPESFEKLQSMK